MFKRYHIRDYDFPLLLMTLALCAIGVLMIGSADETYQDKQFYGVLAGAALMIALSFIDYTTVLKFYWVIYALNLGLLGMVLIAGDDAKGAQRWLEIGSLRFQPSETAKIMLILFFAQFIMKYKEKLNTIRVLGVCIVLVAVPWALVFEQPDLSTSVMLLAIFCVIVFTGGISWRIIAGVLAVTVPALIVLVALALQPDQTILTDNQQQRILAFIHPEDYQTSTALQQTNSVMAIGSGQLDGKGYKNNELTSVKNGDFISESQTDFIFAVIGEEFGFKGCVVVIALEMGVALECIAVARRAKDLAGRIIAAGVGGMIALQSFINIGVVTFILPNTGLPLPFISYGLTSLLSCCMGIGFVMNVRLQANRGTIAQAGL